MLEECLNPVHADISGPCVFLVFEEDSGLAVRKIECDDLNTVAPPIVSNRRELAEMLKLKTWELMKKVAVDLVKSHEFK